MTSHYNTATWRGPLVELEEAGMRVIQKAHEYLLNLEGTLTVDWETILGLEAIIET